MNLTPNANISNADAASGALSCEMLYQQYSGILYGVIKNTISDTLAAESVLEQAFLKICGGKNERAAQVSFLTWAIQQALVSVKEYRDKQQPTDSFTLNKNPYISPSNELRKTDDYCRYVFDLILQGYNANEIAELLKIPLRTVIKNLRIGMKLKAINE